MRDAGPIPRLVNTAASQDALQGIGAILKTVTEELDGWGTLLWMAAPGSDPVSGTGRIFVLAYWVSDPGIRVWHDLPFKSMTGAVMRSGKAEAIGINDERIAKPMPQMILDSKSLHFCLAPMRMEDGSSAVLEVYRARDEAFAEHDVDLLEQMAAVIPALYASLTDRVGFHLVDQVLGIMREADRGKITSDRAFQEIVDRVNDVFRPLEVSLFLEAADDQRGICRLAASRRVWEGPWTEKQQYKAGEGATGWVFESATTVQIVDLAHYHEDQSWIQTQYPGLKWSDSLLIQNRAREYFKVSDTEPSPPLSWLCAAIRGGDRQFGAIRCAGSTVSPFYFDKWQAKLLEGVGVRVGAWWQNMTRNQRQQEEIRAWQKLVQGFEGMNRLVQRSLKQRSWDERAFFGEAMKLAHETIPETVNSDVRLIEDNELVPTAVCGRDWEHAPGWKGKKFTINPPNSAASYLIAKQKGVLVYDDARQAPCFNPILSDTSKLILAPIEAGSDLFGVLCIRSKSQKPFPQNVKLIAGLLGQQLGLYHSLAIQIRNLQRAEATNRQLIDTQAKTIGDVHHQVKSPIVSAYRAAQLLLGNRYLPPKLQPEVERIRGMCSKVSRVVQNMGMFSDLSQGRPIRIRKTVIFREKLLKILNDSSADHQILVDPDRRIVFAVDEKSLSELAGKDLAGKLIEADWALLEQCVNNLLDNAGKYSYDGTTVRVSGGVQSRASEFFISVANQGFVVEPEDVPKMKQRGFRGDEAIWSTGEGSGIGLWIVDEIMRAHGGLLAITPTQNGVTDVRLVFPIVKGMEKLSDEAQSSIARR